MGKYTPLGDYLRSLPADTERVTLSFDQIEDIIGSPLPESMHRVPQTWANVRNANTSEDGWLSAGWRATSPDFRRGEISFVRSGHVSEDAVRRPTQPPAQSRVAPTGRRRKYAPITDFLLGQPPEVNEVAMTFAEIEEVLGDSLPACVAWNGPWWSNTRKLVQGQSWLSAGWAVRRLDVQGQRLVFVREGLPDTDAGDGGVPSPRSPSPARGGRTVAYSRGEEVRVLDRRSMDYVSQLEAMADEGGWSRVEAPEEPRGRRKGGYARLKDYLEGLPSEQEQIALDFADLERVMESRLSATARKDRSWWANTSSRKQTNTWVQAGWRVEYAHMDAGVIVFRRPNTEPSRLIRHYVKMLLDGSVQVSRPDAQTLGRWIRICKQLGWNFEGSILYERFGVVFENADDLEAAAAQEDYEVCKRQLTRHGRGNV